MTNIPKNMREAVGVRIRRLALKYDTPPATFIPRRLAEDEAGKYRFKNKIEEKNPGQICVQSVEFTIEQLDWLIGLLEEKTPERRIFQAARDNIDGLIRRGKLENPGSPYSTEFAFTKKEAENIFKMVQKKLVYPVG